MTRDEAITLARTVINKYGADADKPSVHLAKALLDGAHERDRMRIQIERVAAETNGYWNGREFNGDRAEQALHAIANALGEPF